MIQNELLFLGLLKEGPKHGYDIKTQIDAILPLFGGVDLKSIYYPLKIMETNRLVEKKVMKSGRRPEKSVYSLTPKGDARFKELLAKSFLNFKRPQFSLDLSLYFLPYIKKNIAIRRLRARLLILKKLSKEMQQMISAQDRKSNPSLKLILEHDLQMVDTEMSFIINLIKAI